MSDPRDGCPECGDIDHHADEVMPCPRRVIAAANPPYVKPATLAEITADRRYSDEFVGIVVRERAAAGFHVVQEGQAVVDGRVWEIALPEPGSSGYFLRSPRPLTQPPPVVDEEA